MPKGYNLHPGDPVSSLEGVRPLTTRERSMIQTFPEDFSFDGTKTDIEQMIGNAVPVNLGFFVADAILRYSGEKRLVYTKHTVIKQLNFLDLFDKFELEPITQNCIVREDIEVEYGKKRNHCHLPIDLTKNLLICNVKKDNWQQYLDGSAKIYYTGKKFPTTVALNKLYYFMPYLSGKGIRDLYYIRIVRLGYRKEGQENEDKNELRLVFEIERLGQLFDDYKKVKLEIWRTFTDTTMEKIL